MADVTIASTTDTLEDVRSAAGLPAAESEQEQQEEVPEEEQQAEQPEAEGEAEAEPEEHEEEGQQQVRRPKTSVQKRIDKLTAKNYQLEETAEQARREASDLRKRLEALEQTAGNKGQQQQAQANEFSKPRPQSKDFDDYDKYTDALVDWKQEKKDFEAGQARVAEQQAAQAERQKDTFAAYNKGVAAIHAEYDDYDEVVGRDDLTLPQAVMTAIVGMREAGPEVAYHLAKDEEACERLSEIAVNEGDALAVMEFGRWLAASGIGTQEDEQQEARPARRAAPAASRPIKPVGASSTKSQVAIDELPYQDYARLRREQEKARFRR